MSNFYLYSVVRQSSYSCQRRWIKILITGICQPAVVQGPFTARAAFPARAATPPHRSRPAQGSGRQQRGRSLPARSTGDGERGGCLPGEMPLQGCGPRAARLRVPTGACHQHPGVPTLPAASTAAVVPGKRDCRAEQRERRGCHGMRLPWRGGDFS